MTLKHKNEPTINSEHPVKPNKTRTSKISLKSECLARKLHPSRQPANTCVPARRPRRQTRAPRRPSSLANRLIDKFVKGQKGWGREEGARSPAGIDLREMLVIARVSPRRAQIVRAIAFPRPRRNDGAAEGTNPIAFRRNPYRRERGEKLE